MADAFTDAIKHDLYVVEDAHPLLASALRSLVEQPEFARAVTVSTRPQAGRVTDADTRIMLADAHGVHYLTLPTGVASTLLFQLMLVLASLAPPANWHDLPGAWTSAFRRVYGTAPGGADAGLPPPAAEAVLCGPRFAKYARVDPATLGALLPPAASVHRSTGRCERAATPAATPVAADEPPALPSLLMRANHTVLVYDDGDTRLGAMGLLHPYAFSMALFAALPAAAPDAPRASYAQLYARAREVLMYFPHYDPPEPALASLVAAGRAAAAHAVGAPAGVEPDVGLQPGVFAPAHGVIGLHERARDRGGSSRAWVVVIATCPTPAELVDDVGAHLGIRLSPPASVVVAAAPRVRAHPLALAASLTALSASWRLPGLAPRGRGGSTDVYFSDTTSYALMSAYAAGALARTVLPTMLACADNAAVAALRLPDHIERLPGAPAALQAFYYGDRLELGGVARRLLSWISGGRQTGHGLPALDDPLIDVLRLLDPLIGRLLASAHAPTELEVAAGAAHIIDALALRPYLATGRSPGCVYAADMVAAGPPRNCALNIWTSLLAMLHVRAPPALHGPGALSLYAALTAASADARARHAALYAALHRGVVGAGGTAVARLPPDLLIELQPTGPDGRPMTLHVLEACLEPEVGADDGATAWLALTLGESYAKTSRAAVHRPAGDCPAAPTIANPLLGYRPLRESALPRAPVHPPALSAAMRIGTRRVRPPRQFVPSHTARAWEPAAIQPARADALYRLLVIAEHASRACPVGHASDILALRAELAERAAGTRTTLSGHTGRLRGAVCVVNPPNECVCLPAAVLLGHPRLRLPVAWDAAADGPVYGEQLLLLAPGSPALGEDSRRAGPVQRRDMTYVAGPDGQRRMWHEPGPFRGAHADLLPAVLLLPVSHVRLPAPPQPPDRPSDFESFMSHFAD